MDGLDFFRQGQSSCLFGNGAVDMLQAYARYLALFIHIQQKNRPAGLRKILAVYGSSGNQRRQFCTCRRIRRSMNAKSCQQQGSGKNTGKSHGFLTVKKSVRAKSKPAAH
ncbi:hypothetical protein OP500_03770 [Kingella sp. SNUBH-2017]|uniref:hypothetical protein n=1 Tax=Kingella sp. SNUBH-2017 TaxID=2994077 RepID=UPI002363631D|nr:hypothetical protein [Kingella sp. SNUBH-2017]MDD2182440.1 hypothetical protein [Kingella sp. SNUBH-2017]